MNVPSALGRCITYVCFTLQYHGIYVANTVVQVVLHTHTPHSPGGEEDS